VHQLGVELEQGLAAGADDQRVGVLDVGGPMTCDRRDELVGRLELAATGAVGADEVGVAPARAATRPLVAVLLEAGPQVAAGEAQNTAGRPAFAPSPCSV
jgi:hypothetical protein